MPPKIPEVAEELHEVAGLDFELRILSLLDASEKFRLFVVTLRRQGDECWLPSGFGLFPADC